MSLQFAPAHKVVMKDEKWCQNLFNLLVSFSDLNPNSYDILNNMKLYLTVSTMVKFNAMTGDFDLKIRVVTGFLITG